MHHQTVLFVGHTTDVELERVFSLELISVRSRKYSIAKTL